MSRYYCPYCSSRYQFTKILTEGELVCGQCGELLVKITFIRTTQLFSLITVIALISPFILYLSYYFNNIKSPANESKNYLISNEKDLINSKVNNPIKEILKIKNNS